MPSVCIFPAVAAKIFVYDQNKQNIFVAELADLQFTELLSEKKDVRDFVFDGIEQKLYLVEFKSGSGTGDERYEIFKCNPDGSNETLVFSKPRDDGCKYDK